MAIAQEPDQHPFQKVPLTHYDLFYFHHDLTEHQALLLNFLSDFLDIYQPFFSLTMWWENQHANTSFFIHDDISLVKYVIPGLTRNPGFFWIPAPALDADPGLALGSIPDS